jgi:hypothetical protein
MIGRVGEPGLFRVRSNLGVNWQYGDFGVNYTARYYSGMKESCISLADGWCDAPNHMANGETDPLRHTGSNTFHDLQVSWKAPWMRRSPWARTTCSTTRAAAVLGSELGVRLLRRLRRGSLPVHEVHPALLIHRSAVATEEGGPKVRPLFVGNSGNCWKVSAVTVPSCRNQHSQEVHYRTLACGEGYEEHVAAPGISRCTDLCNAGGRGVRAGPRGLRRRLYCEEFRQQCLASGKSPVICESQYRRCVQDACGTR